MLRICWVCNRLDFQLGFPHGKPISPRGFFFFFSLSLSLFWSMSSIYDIMWYCTEPSRVLFKVALFQRGGQRWGSTGCPQLAQGRFSRVVIHWHESFHPASHRLKDVHWCCSLSILSLRVWSRSASPYHTEPTRACYSVYRQCVFFRGCRWE